MQSRVTTRVVPVVLVSGLVLGVLLMAGPATAEDDAPTESVSPTASSLATNLIVQTIDLAFLADLSVGQVAPLSATASSGLPVTFAASGACTVATIKGARVAQAIGAGECQVTASRPGSSWTSSARRATCRCRRAP